MPDGQFGVDLVWLDGLAADMRQGTEILNDALNALEETGPIRTGHKDLDKACDKFHDNWSHGLGFLRKDIERVGEAIRATRTAYAQTEQTVKTMWVRPPGSAESAPPAAPPSVAEPGRLTPIQQALEPGR